MTEICAIKSDELYFDARIEISSDARLLSVLRRAIESLTLEMGWSISECKRITLAVDEALSNKIRYAYANHADGRIQIEVTTDLRGLVFRLSDQGQAPDASKLCARDKDSTNPGGLGTHIIRDVMDEVLYKTDSGCNQLILTKYLPTRGSEQEAGR